VPILNVLPETLQTLVVSILGLYIVVNPAGVSSVFLGLTRRATASQRRWIALRAVVAGGIILTVFAVAGTFILQQLRITNSALQIAGGIFIFGFAFALARGKEHEFFGDLGDEAVDGRLRNVAYTPLAVPLIAGPAPITVVITSSAQAERDPYAWAALLFSILAVCALCLFSMWRWVKLSEKRGPGFATVASRLMGLVLAVIAVQFIIRGGEDVVERYAEIVRSVD